MAELEPGELFSFGIPTELAFIDAKEIRDALTALAQNHFTTDVTKPADARDGMSRVNRVDPTNALFQIFLGGAWRTVAQRVEAGIPAPIKQVIEFTNLQTWTVDHNLGSQALALAYDLSFVQLKPVNTFPETNKKLATLDASLAPGPILSGWPCEFNGTILSTFAIVQGVPPVGAGPISVDFLIDPPGAPPPVPVVGGSIPLATGPGTGTLIPGAPVTGANVFTPADAFEVGTSGAPLTSGSFDIWARLQRTLSLGECKITQVNDNRITVDHPTPTSGFVVLLG